MKAPALLVLVLCGGCYPWVDGRWEDYAMPDQVQVVGAAIQLERLGGYWGDTSPEGELWWGWLSEPQAGLSALDMLAPEGPGCARGAPDETLVTGLFEEPGASVSVLRGPEIYELPYDELEQRFALQVDEIATGSYDLDPVLSDAAGALEAHPFLSMPPGVPIDGPPLSGAVANEGTLEDLVFSWDASTQAADWFGVEARIAESSPAGYVAFEWVSCLVPFSDGELSIPTALWSDPDRAAAVYIFMGPVDERVEQVGDRDFTASTVGVRRSAGILRL